MVFEGASISARGRFAFVTLAFEIGNVETHGSAADSSDRLNFNQTTTLNDYPP